MLGAVLPGDSQKGFRFVAALWLASVPGLAGAGRSALEQALDGQDQAKLEALAAEASAAAESRQNDAAAQYRAAIAQSTLSQLALEINDKMLGRVAAESGIRAAQRAVALKPGEAEYHRILGTLCGQVIPANVVAGLRWGRCALEEVNRAIELAPASAAAWLSRGVGNYYLPAGLGGGVDKAIADLEKAAGLDSKSADVQLWLGIALRKAGRNREARKAIERSLALNPARKWAREQLEKTPAK